MIMDHVKDKKEIQPVITHTKLKSNDNLENTIHKQTKKKTESAI